MMGSTLSANKTKIINNPFYIMIDRKLLQNHYNDINITASFIIFHDKSSYKYSIIGSVELIGGKLMNNTDNSPYIRTSDIEGIQINASSINKMFGGPYYLLIGLKNLSRNLLTNYYTINMNMMFYQFLVSNENEIDINLSTNKFNKYQYVTMNVSVGRDLENIPIYTVFQTDNDNNIFIAECIAHKHDYYNSFGWKYGGNHKFNNIQSGFTYNSSIYWAVSDDPMYIFNNNMTKKAFHSSSVGSMININITNKISTIPAMIIIDKNNKNMTYSAGSNVSLSIKT